MSILEVKNIKKVFGGLTAVNDFSAQLNDGEVLGLIGPNGAGKTTLINVISGVFRPEGGRVLFKRVDITGLRMDERAKKGLVRTFQLTTVIGGMSVLDNLRLGFQKKHPASIRESIFTSSREKEKEKKITENCLEILEKLRILDYRNLPANTLPIGIQKRVALGISLCASPELLLLDEPIAGLTISEAIEVMDLLMELRTEKRITILMVEHVLKIVMDYCERLIAINYGSKIAEGSPEDIQQNPRVIEAYLGS